MKQGRILTSTSNSPPNGEGLDALPILFVYPHPAPTLFRERGNLKEKNE
jgi:hypothetical protein